MLQSITRFFKRLQIQGESRRRQLDSWKTGFKKINGRNPSLLEIGEYSKEIKAGMPPPLVTEKTPTKNHQAFIEPTSKSDRIKGWKDNLTVLWAGDETIEFTYETRDKSRRKVTVKEVCVDQKGYLCLIGFCHLRQEKRTFKACNIVTKIKQKSKRYDVDEWIEDVLNIDIFSLDNVVY